MIITCTETVSVWTPSDLEHGEISDRDKQVASDTLEFDCVADLLYHLRDYSDLSATHVDRYTWVSYSFDDYVTGYHYYHDLRIDTINGLPVTDHQVRRLLALAGFKFAVTRVEFNEVIKNEVMA